MNNIKNILIVITSIVIIILSIFLLKKQDPEIVKISIPIPVKIGYSDTIFKPSPVKENPINKELVEKYNQAKDTIEKLKLFKDAILEREYNLSYKDSFQTGKVYTKVQGKLLEQAFSYETEPYTVNIDTVLDIPVKKRIQVFGGLEGGLSYKDPLNKKPLVMPGILIKNKKDNIISIKGNEEYILAGYYFKF